MKNSIVNSKKYVAGNLTKLGTFILAVSIVMSNGKGFYISSIGVGFAVAVILLGYLNGYNKNENCNDSFSSERCERSEQ